MKFYKQQTCFYTFLKLFCNGELFNKNYQNFLAACPIVKNFVTTKWSKS